MAAILHSIRSMGNCGTKYDDEPPPEVKSVTNGIPPVAGVPPHKTADGHCGGGDEAIISSSSLSVCLDKTLLISS